MKKYTVDDIQVLTPLEAIRRRPEMYIGGGSPGECLLRALVYDLALHDALPVGISRDGAWWIVSAVTDWLRTTSGTVSTELFFRIIPWPEWGLNAIHSEVLVTALAEAVVTASDSNVTWIVGDEDTTQLPTALRVLMETPGPGRHVAFRMAPEGGTPTP